MNFPFFIAKRIRKGSEGGKQVSKPAVRIATIGIAIGLAVMIVSIAIVTGFKHEIRSKVVGFGSNIQVTNADASSTAECKPIMVNDSLMKIVSSFPGVKHVQRYSLKAGMLKTPDAFQGVLFKGVGGEYDPSFLKQYLISGRLPKFSDSESSNEVLVSKYIADRLHLKLGDKVFTYFIQDNILVRRLKVVGIYQTNFSEYDNLYVFTDMSVITHLNGWNDDQVSGMEISVDDYKYLYQISYAIKSVFAHFTDKYNDSYSVLNIEEANPGLFAWLGLLDMNVWVILILMTGISCFTMISGLLIIILERTNMIGVLKALGASSGSIRKTFLYVATFIIGKGMFWGNVIGLAVCFIQKQFGLFKLDPTTYYIDRVPIEFNVVIWVLLNIATFIIAVIMLVGPSYLISKIRPAKSMRFE
jgi:lipoprotein-releasing system permease protein